MFEVWDINARALDLFLAVRSQWRVVAIAGLAGGAMIYQGLDYQGVDVVMRRGGFEDALFNGLQAMEEAALSAFAELGR